MSGVVAADGGVRAGLEAALDEALTPLIRGHAERICLIDPPGHANVGDSAILLGELAFLRKRFPASHLTYHDVDTYSAKADDAIARASILLLHGGGNFGDLWPRHHTLRKAILERFPDKRIVQLPQSMHFDDPAERDATAAVIGRARDFTLVARDSTSLDFARAHFRCPSVLAPDMAFAIDWLRRVPAEIDYLCLLRTDKEAAADHAAIRRAIEAAGASLAVCDWLSDPDTVRRRWDHALRRVARRSPGLAWTFGGVMIGGRRAYAMSRLAVGTAMLSRGRTVVTDRLHAHILCCLLGIPHFVFDSSGGKVSALYRTWTHRYDCARLVGSADDFARALSGDRVAAVDP